MVTMKSTLTEQERKKPEKFQGKGQEYYKRWVKTTLKEQDGGIVAQNVELHRPTTSGKEYLGSMKLKTSSVGAIRDCKEGNVVVIQEMRTLFWVR